MRLTVTIYSFSKQL